MWQLIKGHCVRKFESHLWKKISKFLVSENQEVLVVGTNEFSIPVVLSDGEEDFLVLTFKMPIGSRDGDGYDGYDMAKDFALKQKMKAEKSRI